jgi:hypothetical protein
MARTLLSVLTIVAAILVSDAATAQKGAPPTKAEAAMLRAEGNAAGNARIVAGRNRYQRPTVSVPTKTIRRLPNDDYQLTVIIRSIDTGWSPIPQRLPQETATFLKSRGQPLVNVTGWTKIKN